MARRRRRSLVLPPSRGRSDDAARADFEFLTGIWVSLSRALTTVRKRRQPTKKSALPSAGRLALHSKSREESAARRTQDTAALARAQWWAGPTLVAQVLPREIHATYVQFHWTTRPSSRPSTEGQAIDGDKVSLSATKEGSVRFVRRTAGTVEEKVWPNPFSETLLTDLR